MADDQNLKVSIGDRLLTCENGEDALVLQPVGGILCDESTEGYSLEELDQMAATLAKYDRPEALATLRQLTAERREQTSAPKPPEETP